MADLWEGRFWEAYHAVVALERIAENDGSGGNRYWRASCAPDRVALNPAAMEAAIRKHHPLMIHAWHRRRSCDRLDKRAKVLAELKYTGKSHAQVAKEFGVHKTTVGRWARMTNK